MLFFLVYSTDQTNSGYTEKLAGCSEFIKKIQIAVCPFNPQLQFHSNNKSTSQYTL